MAALAAVALSAGCATTPAASLPGTPAPSVSSRQPQKTSPAVARLRADLTPVFSAPIMSRGVWAVDIRSLDTGEHLYDLNAGRLMMPASNMKIVTLAAAADILGWDYQFTTTLATTGTVEAGVLKGDLIVRGGGDPTINRREGRSAARLDEWAAALRAAGIQQIDGAVIGDDQHFDDEGIGAGWAWDYLQFGYAAPVGALQFNENLATLRVTPGLEAGAPATVALATGSGLRTMTRVSTAAAGATAAIDYRRRLDQPVLEVSGTIAAGSAPLERTVAVVNPTIFFAQSLKDGLIARGIAISGEAADLDDLAGSAAATAERRTIAETKSPSLREVGTVLMKVSQNLYAETLIKAIGASRGGLGTFEGGLTGVRGALASWGVPGDGYVNADGSGLSRYNYLTASTVVAILERAYKDDRHRDAFVATLPIAGKDGSLSTRMLRSRAAGNAVAKTGSISNVRSLSGYVRTRDGEMLVFSILANDFVIPSATVNWITDLAVEHLANFTRR